MCAVPFIDRQVLYEANTGGYWTYRIPALVACGRGALLAFGVGRREPHDWAEIAVVLRRSTDGGVTWSQQRVVASEPGSTVDNPTPILDRRTGAVILLHQVNYERCYCLRSDDEGQTFSAALDITSTFETFRRDYDWHVLAPGPGHGIQLTNGRLLAPVWLASGVRVHYPSAVAVVYSDDGGRTWERGDIVARDSVQFPNPTETTAVQLHDGRVMLCIRNKSSRYRRLISYSDDGATGWTEPVFHEQLYDPVCCASIVRLSEQPADRNRILFCNPDSQANPEVFANGARWRENLTVRLSYDEGETWPVGKVITPGIAGYSDLAVGPDGRIYCLYESATERTALFTRTQLVLARFNLEWLTDGADSLQ